MIHPPRVDMHEETPMRRSTVEYANPSDQDIVEWLPPKPADRRIRYGTDPLQFGDLRLPERNAPDGHPVVVFVHGGGWSANWNMNYGDPLVAALTDAGVATWSLEFRRVGHVGGGWPGTFLDVGAGLDHLRTLAGPHNLDLDRVVVVGHSSGGHLGVWAAGRHRIPEHSPLYVPDPLPVSGVVSLSGALDLSYRFEETTIRTLLGADADDVKDAEARLEAASPMQMLPLGIPVKVVVGSADNLRYLISDARDFTARATQLGDTVDLSCLEGANHFDVVDPDGPAWEVAAGATFELLRHEATPDTPSPDGHDDTLA
ncbi:alpha/beta hydrolase [Streptomyces sp. NPDC102360]|uniref:alpha/beta hydrolase n=1 Tax=Streptomyces sp. NPDC102360 TaxID=3366160 RepID=UPI0037F78074